MIALDKKKRRKPINLTLDPEVKAQALALAEKTGISLSEIVNRALVYLLKAHDKSGEG